MRVSNNVFCRRSLIGGIVGGAALAVLPAGIDAAASLPERVRVRQFNGSIVSVAVEEYLKGVVGAEVPASWHHEALKAQAVAARSYLAAYLRRNDAICAGVACQAWNPAKRSARSDAAVDATRGELLMHKGEPVWAFYSSTCGGQTAFGSQPYTMSVRCWSENGKGRDPLDLAGHDAATGFWGADKPPPSFCTGAPSFRYRWALDGGPLSQLIDRGMVGSVDGYRAGQLGRLRDLAVTARSLSGKATRLRVVGDGGTWEVTGELQIRSVLRATPAAALRSTNVALAQWHDGGRVVWLEGRGGGHGHGVGLCQYGARGMADRGFDYRAILHHYYSGVELA